MKKKKFIHERKPSTCANKNIETNAMIRKFQKKKEKKQRRETRESRGHEPDLNERMRKGPKGWDTNELRRRRLIDANRHHPEQKRRKKKHT